MSKEEIYLEPEPRDRIVDAESISGEKPPAALSKILSRIRTNENVDPPPPPDGGLKAWSMAVAAHLVLFNIWGMINSFGLFETYYVQVMDLGGESSVAWIGTTQVFILFGMGTWTGRALDAGFFRIQYICGSIVYVFGLFLLSLCKTFWQVFLAQTLCVGFGYGLVFVPTLALVSTYFLNRRSMALGIAVTGSATGGIVFPLIAENALPSIGFGWTMRIMGFVNLVFAIIGGMILKPRLPPRKSGPIVEWAAFQEASYVLYLIASFLYYWAVYIGWYYVGTFARNALGASQSTSINILIALNGVGLVARIVPNYVAQQWCGPLNMMVPLAFLAGIILFCWVAVTSVSGLWTFAVAYGVVAHGLQSLFPVALTSLTQDQSKVGVRSGMGFSVVGLAVLTGPPIAGALIERDGGGFLGLQLFAATSMMLAAAVYALLRWVAVGWTRAKL